MMNATPPLKIGYFSSDASLAFPNLLFFVGPNQPPSKSQTSFPFLSGATAAGEAVEPLPAVSQRFPGGGSRAGYKDPGPRRLLPPGAPSSSAVSDDAAGHGSGLRP